MTPRKAARRRHGTEAILLPAVATCMALCAFSCAAPSGRDERRADLGRRPLSLPDFSRLDPPAKRLIEERRAALDRALGGGVAAGAPGADGKRQVCGRAWGELGQACMACGLDDAAEIGLRNAADLDPADVRWPLGLGHLLRQAGRPEEAASAYERAMSIRPEDPAVMSCLAEVRLAQGRQEEAEALFRRALEKNPASASAHYGLGRIALQRDRASDAAHHFESALAISPSASIVRYSLAQAYRRLGRVREAEAQLALRGTVEPRPYDPFLDGVELLPSARVDSERGLAAFEAGRWKEAADAFRKAVDREPREPTWRLNLGAALGRLGDLSGAGEQFEKALELSPGNARALSNLAGLLAARGELTEAASRYRQALASDPLLVEARLGLADTLQRLGHHAEALPVFERVVELSPDREEARLGEAMMLIHLGRYAEAARSLERSLTALPGSRALRLILARLLATCPLSSVRNGRRALSLLERTAVSRDEPETAGTMAAALAESRRFEEAADWQRAALSAARASGREELTARLLSDLELYEKHRPTRCFWLYGTEGPSTHLP